MHYYPTLQCRSLQSRRRSHTLLWTCWGRVWGCCGVYQSCLLSHSDGSQNSPFLQLLRVLMPSGDSENMGRQRKSGSIHKNWDQKRSTPSRPGLLTNPLSLNCLKKHLLPSNVQWLWDRGERKAAVTWNALLSMCSPSLLPRRLMITCLPYNLRSAVKCLDNKRR